MRITFNNQIYDFDDELLKLSESLKWLLDGKTFEDEPIPLQKCDEEVFEIFKIWFNELKKIGIVENFCNSNEDVFIFKHNMFINYDLETLLKLLDFSFMNQIFLLFETITFTFAKLIKINKFEESYLITKYKISKFYLNIIKQKILHKDINDNTIYTYDYCLINKNETIALHTNTKETTTQHTNTNHTISKDDTKDLTALTVLIPHNVEIIEDKAFANCMDLKRIEIPDSVKFIGNYAFKECRKLIELKIPESVEFIEGDMVFTGCRNLERLILPKHLYNKDLLEEFTITNLIEHDNVYEITMYQTLYRYLRKFYGLPFD